MHILRHHKIAFRSVAHFAVKNNLMGAVGCSASQQNTNDQLTKLHTHPWTSIGHAILNHRTAKMQNLLQKIRPKFNRRPVNLPSRPPQDVEQKDSEHGGVKLEDLKVDESIQLSPISFPPFFDTATAHLDFPYDHFKIHDPPSPAVPNSAAKIPSTQTPHSPSQFADPPSAEPPPSPKTTVYILVETKPSPDPDIAAKNWTSWWYYSKEEANEVCFASASAYSRTSEDSVYVEIDPSEGTELMTCRILGLKDGEEKKRFGVRIVDREVVGTPAKAGKKVGG